MGDATGLESGGPVLPEVAFAKDAGNQQEEQQQQEQQQRHKFRHPKETLAGAVFHFMWYAGYAAFPVVLSVYLFSSLGEC
jgi:hypothetical protein